MKAKSHIEVPPSEEWDFRELDSNTNLRIAVEYEYIRSSHLRDVITNWQSSPFAHTRLQHSYECMEVLRAAGLVTFDSGSSLDVWLRIKSNPDLLETEDPDAYHKLISEAIEQAHSLCETGLSIGESIRRIFDSVRDPEAISYTLQVLSHDLPAEIKRFHAEDIALRFECFPAPWISVQRTQGADYLKRRCPTTATPQSAPAWEFANDVDQIELLETVPSLDVHKFVVDWSRDKNEILSFFKQWLKDKHVQSRPGYRLAEEWLQKLCSFRLMKEYGLTFPKALNVVREQKKRYPGASFGTLPIAETKENWSRSANDVKRDLGRDFIKAIRRSFGMLTLNTAKISVNDSEGENGFD